MPKKRPWQLARWVISRLEYQRGCCLYCRAPLDSDNVTVEHIIPRCWGGDTEGYNVILACDACNKRKSHLEHLVSRDFADGSGLDKCAQLVVSCMSQDPRRVGKRRQGLYEMMALSLTEQADRQFGEEICRKR